MLECIIEHFKIEDCSGRGGGWYVCYHCHQYGEGVRLAICFLVDSDLQCRYLTLHIPQSFLFIAHHY